MPRIAHSPAQRVRIAIEVSGLKLEHIANEIGCTHATLSQWQTGTTNMANVKVGLLLEFCRVTRADVGWLLTGDGDPPDRHSPRIADAPLIVAARHIVQDHGPEVAATAYRVLAAMRLIEPGTENTDS
jgi:transcriptional regulator with XRE-family HTH domain